MPEQKLRRQEPIDLLKQMDEKVAESMVQGTQPETNFWGEIKEGQVFGKDILRPHEQKFYDHYEKEYGKHEAGLYGVDPDDRELMHSFLDMVNYTKDLNMADNYEVPYIDKIYAKKLNELDNKLQDRLKTVQDKVQFDSKQRVPTQMDKYPKNLLTKEESREITSLRGKIRNTALYRDMEKDQRKLHRNVRKRMKDSTVQEYKSKFGFDKEYFGRSKFPFGHRENPREYGGESPSMYDLEQKHRKGFYSQYQKPKVGMMERIMHKLKGVDDALIK